MRGLGSTFLRTCADLGQTKLNSRHWAVIAVLFHVLCAAMRADPVDDNTMQLLSKRLLGVGSKADQLAFRAPSVGRSEATGTSFASEKATTPFLRSCSIILS